jgi:hypothetical protein
LQSPRETKFTISWGLKNPVPSDATDVVSIGLIVAVHIAIIEVQVVGVAGAILGRRPIIVGNNVCFRAFHPPEA